MVNKKLAKEAVNGHVKFREAVEKGLPERFDVGRRLESVLDEIDATMNETAEIASVLLPGAVSPDELVKVKESALRYAEAWRKWTCVVREDIRANLNE